MRVTGSVQTFKPIAGAGLWIKRLLIAGIVLSAVSILSSLMQSELLSRMAQGEVNAGEVNANDARRGAIASLQLLQLIVTGILFLIWFYRAHSNLSILSNRRLQYGSGWAIGGFFVPFLNLVRPFQIMREVWDATMAGRNFDSSAVFAASAERTAHSAVGWWWAFFIASNVLDQIGLRLSLQPNPSLSDLQFLTWFQIGSSTADIPGAALAFWLVDRITARQMDTLRAMDSITPAGARTCGTFATP